MKRILVVGSSRPWGESTRRAAQMVGAELAQSNFGLVTGNVTGVDFWTARAFCATLKRMHRDESDSFSQISASLVDRRGSIFFLPFPTFEPGPESRIRVKSVEDWIDKALERSDAAIVIGGQSGTLKIVRRFIESGKPVFPVPFTGGQSGDVFQEVLKSWDNSKVPNLTRNQFLSLALPWITDTGPLRNLLRGALADTEDIFVSYRRADAATAAARIHRDLTEHFGVKRVFMDVRRIGPGQSWDKKIENAITGCKAGIVVIGNNWMKAVLDNTATDPREPDFVRRELQMLLQAGKAIAPVLVEGASLPKLSDLPGELTRLLEFQATAINNSNWDAVMAQLIRELDVEI